MLYDELMEQSSDSRGRPFNSLGYIAGSIAVGLGQERLFNRLGAWSTKSLFSKHLGDVVSARAKIGRLRDKYFSRAGYGEMGPPSMSVKDVNALLRPKIRSLKNRYDIPNKLRAGRSALKADAANRMARLGAMSKGLSRTIAAVSIFEFMDLGVSLMTTLGSGGISRAAKERDQEMLDSEQIMDTRTAYTQRQRAIQAIHDSQLSVGRAIIGQEAMYLHR